MPFYEYECANCKFYKEVMQKVSDAPLKKCPSCGKNTLKKLVSAPVFRLKGAGWYDNIQHRLNPPDGVMIHFSRLAMIPMAPGMPHWVMGSASRWTQFALSTPVVVRAPGGSSARSSLSIN